jgi:hypothetical protein
MAEQTYTDAKGVEITIGARVKPGGSAMQSQILCGRTGVVMEIRPVMVPYSIRVRFEGVAGFFSMAPTELEVIQ